MYISPLVEVGQGQTKVDSIGGVHVFVIDHLNQEKRASDRIRCSYRVSMEEYNDTTYDL